MSYQFGTSSTFNAYVSLFQSVAEALKPLAQAVFWLALAWVLVSVQFERVEDCDDGPDFVRFRLSTEEKP